MAVGRFEARRFIGIGHVVSTRAEVGVVSRADDDTGVTVQRRVWIGSGGVARDGMCAVIGGIGELIVGIVVMDAPTCGDEDDDS